MSDARRAVLNALARAGLGLPARANGLTQTAGVVTLYPHQVEAVQRLQPLLHQHHGALLADDVGLGKTYVALALASQRTHVHIIAPAGLVPMWRQAIARACLSPAPPVLSLHRFSSTTPPGSPDAQPRNDDHASDPPRTLVVIDEAHHLRNPTTKRYAHVADWCRGADVLLITATPVHNRTHDLHALLALFLGTHVTALSDAERHQLIVRRNGDSLSHELQSIGQRPRIVAHAPLTIPDSPPIARALASLPPPAPTRDGRAAGALISLGLVRAWCSSASACLAAVRRRRAQAAALSDILADGRWPSRTELKAWTVSDDAVQLGFTALLVEDTSNRHTPVAHTRWREQLARHRTALDELQHLLNAAAAGTDRVRAEQLRGVRARHRGLTVVAFSQLADTVLAYGRLLRWDDGVATLTARNARVAGGVLTRAEVLHRVAPRAHQVAAPAAHERIHLLLTTDLLAEGVNLQDAAVVVHLDLPWTPAAIAQREGRLARLGSAHTEVHVYSLQPPIYGDALLQLTQRLRRKARTAAIALSAGPRHTAPRRLVAIPAASSAMQETLRAWLVPSPDSDPNGVQRLSAPLVLQSSRSGWLASVAPVSGGQSQLLGGWFSGSPPSTRASDEPAVLARLIARAGASPTHAQHQDREPAFARAVQRAIARLSSREATRTVVSSVQSPVTRAHQHTRALLQAAPLSARLRWRESAERCTRLLRRLHGAGDERALSQLIAHPDARTPATWFAAIERLAANRAPPPSGADEMRRVVAWLLLVQ